MKRCRRRLFLVVSVCDCDWLLGAVGRVSSQHLVSGDCDWLLGAVGRVSAQHLVRTDSREQKLDAFLVSRNTAPRSLTAGIDDITDFATPPTVNHYNSHNNNYYCYYYHTYVCEVQIRHDDE